MKPPVPSEAKALLARLEGEIGRPMTGRSKRAEPDVLPRCGACGKRRDVVRYGLKLVCRGCAAERDRKLGFAPGDWS